MKENIRFSLELVIENTVSMSASFSLEMISSRERWLTTSECLDIICGRPTKSLYPERPMDIKSLRRFCGSALSTASGVHVFPEYHDREPGPTVGTMIIDMTRARYIACRRWRVRDRLHVGFFACFQAISLERSRFWKIAT